MPRHLPPLLLLLLASTAAWAQEPWLTVLGDPRDPATNTIQVDPTPLEVSGNGRKMRVRVSRSAERTSWDGIAYRSFDSVVLFDCVASTARYLQIRYHRQAGWKESPYKTVSYNEVVPRWMLFREVHPNPHERIVHAACAVHRVAVAATPAASASAPASRQRK